MMQAHASTAAAIALDLGVLTSLLAVLQAAGLALSRVSKVAAIAAEGVAMVVGTVVESAAIAW